MNATPDFTLTNHGTICLLTPNTADARDYTDAYFTSPETQRLGAAVAIEPRYVQDVIDGLENHGWSVEV